MQTTQDCCLKVNRKMLVLRKMFVEEKLGHCPPPCGKILATPLKKIDERNFSKISIFDTSIFYIKMFHTQITRRLHSKGLIFWLYG